jgi:hypothetical protein
MMSTLIVRYPPPPRRMRQLEAVVSRLKILSRNPDLRSAPIASIRFVAVSATMPARFLRYLLLLLSCEYYSRNKL